MVSPPAPVISDELIDPMLREAAPNGVSVASSSHPPPVSNLNVNVQRDVNGRVKGTREDLKATL